jgi:hypothetical protein
MAITYPLSLPTATGIKNISWKTSNAVAYSMSPFTFQGQAHAYSGQRWSADIDLPPMNRAQAEQWISFLISLRGPFGTFYLYDPDAKAPQGTATTLTVTGLTGQSSVTGNSNGTLKAGDYFQIGTGSSSRLYKVLVDKASGSNTMEIWPSLRADASSASADLTNASGVFMLDGQGMQWDANEVSIYGISFSALEKL